MKNMGTHVKVQNVKTQDLTVQWTIVAYRDFLHRNSTSVSSNWS